MFGLSTILALLLSPPADGAAVEQQVAACQSECATRPGLAETDRASCKLQCTSSRRAQKLETEGIRQNYTGARPSTSGSNAYTGSRYTTTAPPPPQPTTPGGYTRVIEEKKTPGQIAACQMGCDQAGLAGTDRATCKLNCVATTRIVHVVTGTPPAGHGSHAGTPAPAPSPTPAPVAGPGPGLNACYDSCQGRAGSDRTTCRLNCESTHKRTTPSPAPASTPAPVYRPRTSSGTVVHRPTGNPGQVATCEADCDRQPGLTATDKATCKLGCTRHTSVVVEQWTTVGPKAPEQCTKACTCSTGCSSHRASCESSCSGKAGGSAATCKLQCQAAFDSCSNACQATGCTCKAR